MAKKRILVCGATGFIGRNLAERLAERDDCEVTGTYFKTEPYPNPKIKFVKANLTNKEDVDNVVSGADVIVQLAAVTTGAQDVVTRPYIHVTDNAIMNARILQAAFDHNVPHHIFVSCTAMYPPNIGRSLVETDLDYGAIYGKYFGGAWTKVYVEKLCEFYSRLKKTKFTVVRHSNVYGPYDKYDLDRSHVFGATITKVVTNTDGTLLVWGDGSEERDLLYVSDLIDFIESAIGTPEKSDFEIYNVGLGKAVSIKELVSKVVKESGRQLEIKYDVDKPHMDTKVVLDTAKAKAMFGWEPKTSLDEGIRLTLKWYKENILKS